MNDQIESSTTKKTHLSIGILLLGVFFLASCQSASAQINESPVPSTLPTATVTATMLAPTETPPPTPTHTVTASVTQSNQNDKPVTLLEATINVVDNPKLGKILVDGNGMTLYMYTKDGPNQSNCSGLCLEAWPPLLTQGNPTLGDGVDASMIGKATLADGSMIVTYNKMPLYTWYKDTKPGDATGQGNKEVWYVVSPDGKAVGLPQSSTDYSYSYDK